MSVRTPSEPPPAVGGIGQTVYYALMIPIIETQDYGPDVHFLRHGDREIILVGTAHISQESVELVRTVIDQMRPDCVCLELDDKRYQALTQREQWQSLDLKAVIRNK
ncbi:MAG TPA: TraB domain-containing protein, partial [Desulfoprunum sp.]|nr:TraB domain-containing protein [Desulfoprunum sp.]